MANRKPLIKEIEDLLQTDAFYENSVPLCEHIRSILQSKEDLNAAYSNLPYSTTILLADPKTRNYSIMHDGYFG